MVTHREKTFQDATFTKYYVQNNIWHVRRKRAAHINQEKNVALPTNDSFPRDIVNFNLIKIEMDAV